MIENFGNRLMYPSLGAFLTLVSHLVRGVMVGVKLVGVPVWRVAVINSIRNGMVELSHECDILGDGKYGVCHCGNNVVRFDEIEGICEVKEADLDAWMVNYKEFKAKVTAEKGYYTCNVQSFICLTSEEFGKEVYHG